MECLPDRSWSRSRPGTHKSFGADRKVVWRDALFAAPALPVSDGPRPRPGEVPSARTLDVMGFLTFTQAKTTLPTADSALRGRDRAMPVLGTHLVLDHPTVGPWPTGYQTAIFGMGCFWGIEKLFWKLPGVWSTAAGYAGGLTPNPSYEEVCSGKTGHTEVVLVVFDREQISYQQLLVEFWENHDPTQGMRQHNDTGTQYRSAIYTTTPEQQAAAEASLASYQQRLSAARFGRITTELKPAAEFYYAEDYHQQYLFKNPHGYCNMHGTGISCSIASDSDTAGLGVTAG
jgi:peptide-methionine (S)-S-oxide reductase